MKCVEIIEKYVCGKSARIAKCGCLLVITGGVNVVFFNEIEHG